MKLPKILIVDDREYDRMLYKEFLGTSNYDFKELDDGELILETSLDYHPDLILLDWQMPRVSGLEALKILKKNNTSKDIPIIIITGLEDEKVLEEAFDYGSIDFLNKPVSNIELNARVLNVLRHNDALATVLKQKKELEQLNQIIQDQKQALEKTLEFKTEKMDTERGLFEQDLEKKNKKLLTKELNSTKLINDLKSIRSLIQASKSELRIENPESKVLRRLQMVERDLDHLEINDNSFSEFDETFENIDPDFYKKLSAINPKLTPNDLKNCAYIKMNLDNYEVSKMLNVELKSLQMTRYRLKKKLNLNESTQLREFIHAI